MASASSSARSDFPFPCGFPMHLRLHSPVHQTVLSPSLSTEPLSLNSSDSPSGKSSGIKYIFVINPSQVFPMICRKIKFTLSEPVPCSGNFCAGQFSAPVLLWNNAYFFHKKLRPCQTETIDTLLYISYHEDIFLLVDPPGYCCCQKLLH